MKNKRRVLISQGFVPHYRGKFFDLLRRLGTEEGIDIVITASGRVPSHFIQGRTSGTIEASLTRIGPFIWQNTLRSCQGCDLVIAQQEAKYITNYILQLKRLVSPQKFAFWGHGKNFQADTSSLVAEYLKERTSLYCDWWFAYNDLSADVVAALGFPRERITSVMNSIDTVHLTELKRALKSEDLAALRRQLGIRGDNIAVFTGGLYEEKRLRFLVEACRLVREKIPDFELIVIGSGPDSSYVKLSAQRYRWLHYVGPKTDEEKVPYWALSKTLLMPGLVGLVVLDSFALGVPIITTDYPEHSPEISYLKNGVNGIVSSPWPSVAAYAGEVTRFMLSPDLQKRMASSAEASAKDYSVEKMAGSFFAGITAALDAPKLRIFKDLKPRSIAQSASKPADQVKRLAIVARSLSPYTRNFYDQLARERGPRSTVLIVGRRESDWINPWEPDLLLPQVAEYTYADAATLELGRPILLPSRSLLAALERIRPDILAVQEFSTFCVFAILWTILRRKPFVLMTDVGDSYGPPYPRLTTAQKMLHRWVISKAKGVMARAPDAEKRANRRGKPCLLAPHAIDTSFYKPRERSRNANDPVVLMTAGNFIYRKGHDLLLKALAMANRRENIRNRWRLKCYGSGETKELLKLADELGITHLLELHSFVGEAELALAYQEADAFVLASRKETYGVVVHEAAASGLPLIISKHVGAMDTLAKEGENAFCIDPDDTAMFAAVLEKVISDSELRNRFGQRSRAIAEYWDVSRNARRASQWIENLTA
jgi:glycosyltransferase involved in cell wall biosynthesis